MPRCAEGAAPALSAQHPAGCRASPSSRAPPWSPVAHAGAPSAAWHPLAGGPHAAPPRSVRNCPACRPHSSLGKPRLRAEREPPRRVEPAAAGSQGQSRGGRGGAPEGEKESAAESKRRVGEGCQDLGLLGSVLDQGAERGSGQPTCTHPVVVAESARLAQEGESRSAGKAGLKWPAAVTPGSRNSCRSAPTTLLFYRREN